MSWKRMRLGKFLEVRKGKFKPNDPAIANLKRVDKIDFSGQIHLSDKSSNTDMILIKKGDLLISGINVAKGAVTVYEGDVDIVATVHYSSYVYDADQIDITFLKLFLQSPEFFNAIREQIPGGIKTEIKPKHLLPLEVIIPSELIEQKKVAALYFEFQAKQNALGSELTQQLTHLTHLRQALLREAMQGQMLPQDPTDEPAALLLKKLQAAKAATGKRGKGKAGVLFAEEEVAVEGPFKIPENWVWCKMEYLYSQLLGGLAFESSKYTKGESNNQVLRLGNVKNDCLLLDAAPVFIDEEYATAADSARLKPDDILITMTGTRAKKDYLFSLKLSEEDFANKALFLNQRVGCFRFPAGISASYINCLLKDRRFLAPVFDSATGAANQANVGIGALKAITIPLPPLAEQHRIVAKLEQLMQHCDALEQRIRESRRLAEQLLQTALREALAPPAGTEPAEVAELELAEAEAAPASKTKRGRPHKSKFSLDNPPPDLFDF